MEIGRTASEHEEKEADAAGAISAAERAIEDDTSTISAWIYIDIWIHVCSCVYFI